MRDQDSTGSLPPGPKTTNTCCFCLRPADASVPCGLAELVPAVGRRAVPLLYHEACAGYSSSIAFGRVVAKGKARQPYRHSQIPAGKVELEWARSTRNVCSICGQPGATLNCKGIGTCGCIWHLPCAREAAQSGGNVVFSAGVLEAACHQHADMIADRLEEPCGDWFQSCGGWDNHQPTAAAAWQAAHKEQSAGPAAAGKGAEWEERDGMLYILEGSSEEGEEELEEEEVDVGQQATMEEEGQQAALEQPGQAAQPPQQPESAGLLKPPPRLGKRLSWQRSRRSSEQQDGATAAAPEVLQEAGAAVAAVMPPASSGSSLQPIAEDEAEVALPSDSWRIPGHKWVTQGDIDGPPPRSAGDLLVLNMVIPCAYRETYKRVTATYVQRMRESPKEYPAVVAAAEDPVISQRLEWFIKKHMTTRGTLRSPDQLPDLLPVAEGERFAIPADDPRRALAADPGALGWRCRSQGSKRVRMRKNSVLGAYQSIQLRQPDYSDMVADTQLAADMKLTPSQLAACCEAYAADSSVGDGYFNRGKRVAEPLLAELDLHEDFQLIYSAWGFGDRTSLINDVSIQPLADLKSGKRQLSHMEGGANCVFVEALVFGWPHLFVITSRDIEPGEEYLLDYGKAYWQTIAKEKQRCYMSEAEQRQLRAMYETEQARLMKAAQEQAATAAAASSVLNSGERGAGAGAMETQASGVVASRSDTRHTAAPLAATAAAAADPLTMQAMQRLQQQQMVAVADARVDPTAPVRNMQDGPAQQLAPRAVVDVIEGCATSPGPKPKPLFKIPHVPGRVAATGRRPAGSQQQQKQQPVRSPQSLTGGSKCSVGFSSRRRSQQRQRNSRSRSRSRLRSRNRRRSWSRGRSRRRSESRSRSRWRSGSRSRNRRCSESRSRQRNRSRSQQWRRSTPFGVTSRQSWEGIRNSDQGRHEWNGNKDGRSCSRGTAWECSEPCITLQPAAPSTARACEPALCAAGVALQTAALTPALYVPPRQAAMPALANRGDWVESLPQSLWVAPNGSGTHDLAQLAAAEEAVQQQCSGPPDLLEVAEAQGRSVALDLAMPSVLEQERSGTPDLEDLALGPGPSTTMGAVPAPMSHPFVPMSSPPPRDWTQSALPQSCAPPPPPIWFKLPPQHQQQHSMLCSIGSGPWSMSHPPHLGSPCSRGPMPPPAQPSQPNAAGVGPGGYWALPSSVPPRPPYMQQHQHQAVGLQPRELVQQQMLLHQPRPSFSLSLGARLGSIAAGRAMLPEPQPVGQPGSMRERYVATMRGVSRR